MSYVKHHAAAIASIAVSAVVFVGCDAALGAATAGVGAVPGAAACGALAGAVGNAVSYGISAAQTGQFSWSGLGKSALAGAAIGGLTGGLAEGAAGAVSGLLSSGAEDAASALSSRAADEVTSATSEAAATTADATGRSAAEDAAARSDGEESARSESCLTPGGQSFTADTKVLTASGGLVAISKLKPGDKVLATNTRTGKTQAEPVAAVLVHYDKDRYDLKVRAAGRTAVIHTTRSHLFWNQATRRWTKAGALKYGTKLRTPSSGTATVVGGYTPKVTTGWMWDLTVPGNNDHDFYVLTGNPDQPESSYSTHYAVAGNTPVLVHNSSCFDPVEVGAGLPEYTGGVTSGTGISADGTVYDVTSGSKAADADLLNIVNDRLRASGRLPGAANSARASDAEQKFAAIMTRDGIDRANLVINNPVGPCTVTLGCNDVLDTILGDRMLTIHWPDGNGGWMSQTYGGAG